MKKTVDRSRSLKTTPFRYCPGCGHIIIHRLIAEVIDGLNIRERVIGIAPVGCAVFAHEYFDFDMLEAAHGRHYLAGLKFRRVEAALDFQKGLLRAGLWTRAHAYHEGHRTVLTKLGLLADAPVVDFMVAQLRKSLQELPASGG